MIDDDNQVNVRVLRKRKIHLETVVQELNSTVSNKAEYNVLAEHNYFRAIERKNCRWPDAKNPSKVFNEALTENNTNNNTDYSSENSHILPDYLKGFESSSDDECEDDTKFERLSVLLRKEFVKDFLSKKSKYTRASKILPINTTLKKLFPDSVIKIRNYDSNKTSEINLMSDNSHNYASVSQDSLSGVGDCTIGVENPENLRIISACSINPIISQNQNVNEFQTMTISGSLNSCTYEKSNAEKVFICDDMLFKDLTNKKDSIENCIQDTNEESIQNSENDLLNSPIVCNNDTTESSKSSEENSGSLCRSPIVINSFRLPEYVSPPFEWYHIIYLVMKNSTNEYVTCQEIQNFTRRWFPFYCYRSWIKDIRETLYFFQDKLFIRFSFSFESDDVWTLKEKSVVFLEFKVLSIADEFETAIKSSMKNPDQLSLLLKGYGVFNLGYNKK